jgi:hypothetical protein
MERTLPAVGSKVVTAKGQGRVVALEILVQKLVVEFDDHRRVIVGRDEISSAEPPKGRTGAHPDLDDTNDRLTEPRIEYDDQEPPLSSDSGVEPRFHGHDDLGPESRRESPHGE